MKFEAFLKQLDMVGYGILAFNTYHLNGKFCFYMTISQKGENGTFIKAEGEVKNIEQVLYNLAKKYQ